MASITQYARGWRAQLYVKIGGVAVRDSATFRTRREAATWAAQREEALRHPPPERHTLQDALERYRDEVSPGRRGERWELLRIGAMIREAVLPVIDDISALTPESIGVWRDLRLKKVSAGTVLREMGLLSAILETARREWRWIASNPLSDVRKPKTPQHREVVISPPAVRKMLQAMGYRPGPCRSTTQAVAVAFLVALRTGMRAGELCRLRWADVHEGYVSVTAAERGAGKTGRRDVPAVWQTARLIASMRGFDTDYVFGISAQSLDALFRRYRNRAGLEGFTFHDSRHTAATRLARRLSVLDLCKCFGWKNPSMAMVYYNPSAESIRRQLERGRPRKSG